MFQEKEIALAKQTRNQDSADNNTVERAAASDVINPTEQHCLTTNSCLQQQQHSNSNNGSVNSSLSTSDVDESLDRKCSRSRRQSPRLAPRRDLDNSGPISGACVTSTR